MWSASGDCVLHHQFGITNLMECDSPVWIIKPQSPRVFEGVLRHLFETLAHVRSRVRTSPGYLTIYVYARVA
jgi:hypothetical protein